MDGRARTRWTGPLQGGGQARVQKCERVCACVRMCLRAASVYTCLRDLMLEAYKVLQLWVRQKACATDTQLAHVLEHYHNRTCIQRCQC